MMPDLSSSGVSQKTAALAASYFRDAQARFKRMILKPTGGTAASQEFRRGRAAQLATQVDAIILELKGKASRWVGANLVQVYREGIATAERQAVEAGVKVEGSAAQGSFSVIDQRTVIALAADTAGDFNRAADSLGGRTKTLLRQTAQLGLDEGKINAILAGGVIAGQPVETIRKLRDELKAVHGDTVKIVGKDGVERNYDVASYAETVARTKTREATVVARHNRLESLDIDLVAIVGRVSNTFCTAFLGQVFSLSGRSSRYPAYSSLPGGGPPFHPNCSKSTRPFIAELASGAQERAAEILPDAAKLLGADPADAQKKFKDLQLHAQVKGRYATTKEKLFAA